MNSSTTSYVTSTDPVLDRGREWEGGRAELSRVLISIATSLVSILFMWRLLLVIHLLNLINFLVS